MKSLKIFVLLLFSGFFLSACGLVNTSVINPPSIAPLPSSAASETPTPTDDQIQNELGSDPNFNIDADFDNLNSYLQ